MTTSKRTGLVKAPQSERGFSIVEVLLAATVFGFLVTALVGTLIYGRASTADAGDRVRALQLAEEGIEAVRNIAAASYASLVDNGLNLGDTAIEPNFDSNINGTSAFKVNSGTTAGTVTSVSIYIKTVPATNQHIQAAIYADAGGNPGALLGSSIVQIATANSWNVFPISDVTIIANTNYWLAISEDGDTQFANNSSGGTAAYDLTAAYPAANPFTVEATTVDRASLYMTVSNANTGYGLVQSAGQWALSGLSDTTGIYTRKITVSTAGANRKNITSTVSWALANGSTSSVTLTSRLTNWQATLPITPGPIMMAYSKTTTTPFYRTWNGTSWSAEGSAQAVTGNINYVVLKSARTRNEAILGVQTSTGAIYVQVWNGTSWGNLTQVGTGSTTTRSFDIAYERNGDRAVIVYAPTATSADFAYRIWNGASYTAAVTIPDPPTTGAINWIELDQNPLSSSNEVSMMMLDANADVYGMRWTGSAWNNMGVATAWTTTAASATKKAIDVEYEQTSGKAMFIWGDAVATDQYYRTWNGTTLSAATLLDIPAEGGVAEWIQLAARPSSNEIMVGIQDAGADLNTRKWSGSAWDTATQHAEHSAATENIASRNFDIIWETYSSNLGKAWLVWGDGATVSAKQWSGTAWGTASVLTGSDDTSFIRLRADPASGAIFAGIYQNSTAATTARDINERHLTGGSASWTAKNVIWGGPTGTDPVFFRVDISTP